MLRAWLKKLADTCSQARPSRRAGRPVRRVRLSLEPLERRELLSAAVGLDAAHPPASQAVVSGPAPATNSLAGAAVVYLDGGKLYGVSGGKAVLIAPDVTRAYALEASGAPLDLSLPLPVPAAGVVYLTSAGHLYRAGAGGVTEVDFSRGNVADVTFDPQGRLVAVDHAGTMVRSKGPNGTGGWDELGRGVVKYAATQGGDWIVLQKDGQVRAGGRTIGTNEQDFALDPSHRLYLLGRDESLRRSNGPDGSGGWAAVTSGVVEMQVNPATGDVWALNQGGRLFRNGSPEANNVAQFVVGDGGNTDFYLTRNGWVYSKTGGSGWGNLFGNDVIEMVAGDSGATTYFLTAHGGLYSVNRSTGFRQENVGGNPTGVAQLVVGDNGSTEFALMHDGQVYVKNPASAWGPYAGGITRLAVGDGGYTTFLLAASGNLYGVNRTTGFHQIGWNVTSFQVSPDGSVYALNTVKEVWRYTTGSGHFTQIGWNVTSFGVSADGSVYALNTVNELFRYTETAGHFTQIGWNVAAFQVSPDGSVYALNTVNQFFRYTTGSGTFTQIDSGVLSFAVGVGGRVYALKDNGVFMASDDGRPGDYWQIDSGVQSFAIGPTGRVYALKENGVLEASDDGRPGYYWYVAGNVTKFAIRPTDGSVWTLTADSWLSVNGNRGWINTSDFAFGPDGSLYKLDQGGQLYQRTNAGNWVYRAGNVGLFTVHADGSVTTQPPAWLDGGTLEIVGTPGSDNIRVVLNTVGGWFFIPTSYTVWINGRAVQTFSWRQVSRIRVVTGNGNDTVDLTGVPLPAEVYTGNGNNHVYGSNGGDLLVAGNGYNYFVGGDGDDVMIAGPRGSDVFDPIYERTKGNDTYIVPGLGSVDRARYEWRDIYRADGSKVSVREDNKGQDQLEYNGTIGADGQLRGFTTDHMDDDGFWSAVGSFIENNLGKIVEGVGLGILSVVTGGATTPLLAAAEAGGADLVGQIVDMAAEGRSFSLAGLVGSFVGGYVGGEFGEDYEFADSKVLGGAVKGLTSEAAAALASEGVGVALEGGRFDLSGVLSEAVGGAVEGSLEGADLPIKDESVGAKVLDKVSQGMAKSLASQGVNVTLNGGQIDWVSVLTAGVPQGVGVLLGAGAQQVGKLFQAKSSSSLFTRRELDDLFTLRSEVGTLVAEAATGGLNADFTDRLASLLGETYADGLAGSSFVQDGLSFLGRTVADGLGNSPTARQTLSLLEQTVAAGLSGSSFARGAASFLEQAPLDRRTSSPFVQNAVSFLSRTVTDGLSGSPFAENAVSFLDRVAARGSALASSSFALNGATFLNQLVVHGAALADTPFARGASSFLNQTVAAGLTASTFASQALGVLNQTLAAGLTASARALGAVEFFSSAVGGGLTGTPFSPAGMTSFAIAPDGTAWLLSDKGAFGEFQRGRVRLVAGQVVSFALGGDGTAWFVGAKGQLYYSRAGQGAPTPDHLARFVVTVPGSTTAGTPATVTVTAKDASGNVIADYNGTVHFSSSDRQAGLPADYTFRAADLGTHRFAVTLKTAGTDSILAAAGAVSDRASVQVAAAAASRFVVTAPSTATAGTAFVVTITARDPFGNTATTYNGRVTLSSSDGQRIFLSSPAITLHAGTATTTVTLDVADTATLTAASGALRGSSGSIRVHAAAPARVELFAPYRVVMGHAFGVLAWAVDSYGNGVSGVPITLRDSTNMLDGNKTVTTNASGLASFTGLSERWLGNKTLTASASGLTSASVEMSVSCW